MVVTKKGLVIGVLVTALLAITGSFSWEARAAYPEKPVTIIIPFGVGGGFDTLARALAVRMEKDLGTTFVVKSQPGGGGRRGGISIFKSKPDGYTIGFSHFIPFLSDEILLGKKPPVDYNKFEVLLKITHSRHFIYVGKNTPFKSLKDLKNAGRPIKFSGTAIGAITWVEASAVGSTVGFPVSFVTGYRNLPAASIATARGDADASVGSFVHFRGVIDDVRPIVFLGKERDARLSDVPSIQELGYGNLTNLGSPRVLSAPPGTPKDRQEVLRKSLQKIVSRPEFIEWAKEAGYYPDPEGPVKFEKSLKSIKGIFRNLKPLFKKSN